MTQQDHKPDYVIRKRRSSNWYWALTLLTIAILIMAVALGYWLNQRRYDFSETAQEQFDQAQVSLTEANAIAVRWQQQYELEKAINQELRKHTFDLELKLHNRNKEVEAFQRIFDPDSVESGLQIASFSWEPVTKNRFQYRLILTQAKQQNIAINGKYEITLIGQINDEHKEISFNELESLTEKDRKFKFKYMEARSGLFQLPKDFKPKLIRVLVTSTGKNGKSILQDFEWNKATKPEPNKENNKQLEEAPVNPEPSGGN